MSHPHTTRTSIYQTNNNASSNHTTSYSHTNSSMATTNRQRQYAHLNAQLAQLNAHLADMENLLRMTAVQAEYVRGLGGWMGGLFMASSKILGEETGAVAAAAVAAAAKVGRPAEDESDSDALDEEENSRA